MTHSDINKFIKKFVTEKQGNVSFLLTTNEESKGVDVSIQGKANSDNLFSMFASLFNSMPQIVPIFDAAIMYHKNNSLEKIDKDSFK